MSGRLPRTEGLGANPIARAWRRVRSVSGDGHASLAQLRRSIIDDVFRMKPSCQVVHSRKLQRACEVKHGECERRTHASVNRQRLVVRTVNAWC